MTEESTTVAVVAAKRGRGRPPKKTTPPSPVAAPPPPIVPPPPAAAVAVTEPKPPRKVSRPAGVLRPLLPDARLTIEAHPPRPLSVAKPRRTDLHRCDSCQQIIRPKTVDKLSIEQIMQHRTHAREMYREKVRAKKLAEGCEVEGPRKPRRSRAKKSKQPSPPQTPTLLPEETTTPQTPQTTSAEEVVVVSE